MRKRFGSRKALDVTAAETLSCFSPQLGNIPVNARNGSRKLLAFRDRCAPWSAPAIMDTSSFGTTLLSASSAFAVTNIDEIVLLALFFANPRLRPPAVATGHFLGLAALIAVSVLAGLAALAVPHSLTRYLGVVPIALGAYELLRLRRARRDDSDDEEEAAGRWERKQGFTSQTLAVAGVAIANGSDNLSVYIPMFAGKPDAIPLSVTVFGVWTAVLCFLGFALAHNRVVGGQLQRYGKLALPLVLILVGLDILVS